MEKYAPIAYKSPGQYFCVTLLSMFIG